MLLKDVILNDPYKRLPDKEYGRWKCRNDLFFLSSILGHKEIEKYRSFYEPLCQEVSLMNWAIVKYGIQPRPIGMPEVDNELYQKRLFLWFRTAFKTTIITKIHTLQLLLNFPNIRIALVHNKQENASDNLISIRSFFHNKNLKRLFPEYVPQTKDWGNMSGFTVASRTDKTKTEDSVEAIGIDTEVIGRHYDVFKKDDLVTEKSVNTEEQIKKTKTWNELSKSLFDNPTIAIEDIIGTRYHFADLYSQLLGNNKIHPSIIGFEDETVKKLSERFTAEGIENLKSDGWTYSCQYLLKPEDPTQRRFTDEMIKYYHTLPRSLNYYLLVDPASRRKKKSDWTVMLIVGVDSKGNRYLADIVRDKLDPKQRIDESFKLIEKWNCKGVAWETIAFQETDIHYFKEIRRTKKYTFGLYEINSHASKKEDRIRSLIPEYSNQRWFWPEKGKLVKYITAVAKSLDMIEELEYEFFQFPLGVHDDILDAMTFLNRVNLQLPPGEKKDGVPYHSAAWIEQELYKQDLKRNKGLPRRLRKKIEATSLT